MIIENNSIFTQNRIGAGILLIIQVLMIVFYGIFIRYQQVYPNQEDLEIIIGLCMLILIGFGLILSYLKQGALSGIGFTLLITTIVFQLFFLINAFWARAGIQQSGQHFGDSDYHHNGLIMGQNTIDTPVNVYPFTNLSYLHKSSGDFTVWAALKCSLAMVVAFAALIGRAGVLEISIMIPIGTIIYELNSQTMSRYAFDLGSSMRVFLFGGLFGFVCSWAMRNPINQVHPTYLRYTSSKFTSILALIGSVFCFILFPLLSQQRTYIDIQLPIYNYMKFACTVNVILSMTSSVITATAVSMMFGLKIGMKDFIFASITVRVQVIQGGIVIGSSSNMITNPAASLIIGGIAGTLQVMWNRWIDRHINEISIIDSLSSLGLFALSGFQGGIYTAIFSAIQSSSSTQSFFYANQQGSPNNFSILHRSGGQQVGALFMTSAIAIITGGFTGWILYFINKYSTGQQFLDSTHWKVQDDGICFQDIHSLNMSSYYSNHTGSSMQGMVINIAPPEVVLPMVGMTQPVMQAVPSIQPIPPVQPMRPPMQAPIVSPIIRPGGNITGPCSYL